MALPYYFPWNLSRQFPRTQKKFRLLGFALRTPGMDPAHLTSSLLLVSPSAWPLPLPLSVHPLTLPKHVLYFPTLLCSHWTLLPISFSLLFIMCLASTKCGAFYSVSQSNMSRIFSADIAQVPSGSTTFYDKILVHWLIIFLLKLSDLYWCCLITYQSKEHSVRERGNGEKSHVKKCQKQIDGHNIAVLVEITTVPQV